MCLILVRHPSTSARSRGADAVRNPRILCHQRSNSRRCPAASRVLSDGEASEVRERTTGRRGALSQSSGLAGHDFLPKSLAPSLNAVAVGGDAWDDGGRGFLYDCMLRRQARWGVFPSLGQTLLPRVRDGRTREAACRLTQREKNGPMRCHRPVRVMEWAIAGPQDPDSCS